MAIMLSNRLEVVGLNQVASVLALGMKPHVRKTMEQNEEKLAENELLEVGDIGLDDDAAEHVRERYEGGFDLWQ
jgi:hypothetical protein